MADEKRVRQVIWNRVECAEVHRGGEITVSVRVHGEHAELCVRDTGRGIGADVLGTHFRTLLSGGRQRTRGSGPAGLWLARIVRLHGGRFARIATAGGQGRDVRGDDAAVSVKALNAKR
jgi:signal transduction histidine kinase